MKKLDWFVGSVFFGFILFISCFCAGWFIGAAIGDRVVYIGCALGGAAGIAANILFLKKLTRNMYSLHPLLLVVIYLLYSVGIFGFFMGVPAFNALMGVAAGWYIGRRANLSSTTQYKKPLIKALGFSTVVLAAFCVASAWLALNDHTTAANLEGMFNLGFHVTNGMIWGIILLGGALLLLIQAAAAVVSAKAAYRMKTI